MVFTKYAPSDCDKANVHLAIHGARSKSRVGRGPGKVMGVERLQMKRRKETSGTVFNE